MSEYPPRPPRPERPDRSPGQPSRGRPPRPLPPGIQPGIPSKGPQEEQVPLPFEDHGLGWRTLLRIYLLGYLRKGGQSFWGLLKEFVSSKPSQIPWAARNWWRNNGWGSRSFALLVAFLVCGALLRMMGCGEPAEIDSRLAGQSPNQQTAQILSEAKDRVQSSDNIQSANKDLKLRATYQSDPRMLIVQSPEETVAVQENGSRWVRQGSCWQRSGTAPKPQPLDIVLPLGESGVVFQPSQTQSEKQKTVGIVFQSQNLGAWGPGEGQLILQKGRPSGFKYMPDTGTGEYSFQISYPDKPMLENLQPQC